MPIQRGFRVVLVRPDRGAGSLVAAAVDREITYSGHTVAVVLK
jgi:hypothetical protein